MKTATKIILLGTGVSLMVVVAMVTNQGMKGNAVSEATLRAEISQYLRDPDSAHFTGLHVVTKPEGYKYLCGFVNGRNGFGGYTGFQPFLASLNTFGHVSEVTFVSEYATDSYVLSSCRVDGRG